MVRYVLWTVYNCVLDVSILLEEAVIPYAAETDISNKDTKIANTLNRFYNVFFVKAQTVSICLSESQSSS